MSEKSEYKISVGNTAYDFSRETFLISPTETTLETNPINFKKKKTKPWDLFKQKYPILYSFQRIYALVSDKPKMEHNVNTSFFF